MATTALVIAILALIVGSTALVLTWYFSLPLAEDPFDDGEDL